MSRPLPHISWRTARISAGPLRTGTGPVRVGRSQRKPEKWGRRRALKPPPSGEVSCRHPTRRHGHQDSSGRRPSCSNPTPAQLLPQGGDGHSSRHTFGSGATAQEVERETNDDWEAEQLTPPLAETLKRQWVKTGSWMRAERVA